jgi:hypothetical protein
MVSSSLLGIQEIAGGSFANADKHARRDGFSSAKRGSRVQAARAPSSSRRAKSVLGARVRTLARGARLATEGTSRAAAAVS